MALINLDKYKTYAGIKSTNYDAEISAIIPAVIQLVKNYCRKTFQDYVTMPATEILDGGHEHLILTESPLLDVITVEYSSDYGQTWTALTEYVDWIQAEDSVQSTSASGFKYVLNGYKVTYQAGYLKVPKDLEIALCELIDYYRKNDSAVHSSRDVGSSSNTIEYITAASLPASIRRVLDFYKADYL